MSTLIFSYLFALCFRLVLASLSLLLGFLLILAVFLLSPIWISYLLKYAFDPSSLIAPPKLSLQLCDELEERLISQRKFSFPIESSVSITSLRDEYKLEKNPIPRKEGTSVTIHSLVVEHKNAGKDVPNLLWIHGVGGTAAMSLVFSGIADRIAGSFKIYAVDMPAMGRSEIDSSAFDLKEDEVEELMVAVLLKYVQSRNLNKVHIVAHSGGAHHAVKFAIRYPEFVEKLLLLDGGGFFPTWSSISVVTGFIFKLGIPTYQLRSLGRLGVLLFNSVCWFKGTGLLPYYWYQVQASQGAVGDYFVSKFQQMNVRTTVWVRPGFRGFLNLKMPLALAYGEKDVMIPPHQGFMLSAMAGSEIPLYVLADSPHNPLHIREGLLFSKMLPAAFKSAKCVTSSSSWLAELPSTRDGLKFELGQNFHATFSRALTHQAIHRLYDQLLSYRRGKKLPEAVHACEKPLPLLKLPPTFLVDKDGIVTSVDIKRYLDEFKDCLSSHFIDDDKQEIKIFSLDVVER